MISVHLRTLLSSYHPNSFAPNGIGADVEPYLAALSQDDIDALYEEMNKLLKDKKVDKEFMERALGENLLDEQSAIKCFSELRDFFCGKRSEPDIAVYFE
ncbi:hypothetical protein [Pseudaestuariivita rosea]|uniref:hypothetical protein n=1 Tax=Pseudaestuariivita rosea TaxID=2763263 RepID=UPI001ABA2BD4|nr:hypothetical protein [Pseudaestuariivita rosea]